MCGGLSCAPEMRDGSASGQGLMKRAAASKIRNQFKAVMRMNIPLVDLRAQYHTIKSEIDAAVLGLIESTQYINGQDVRKFEQEFAEYSGAKHAVGVGNGTDAISLALKAAGVGQGDEVITVANTFIATAEAVSNIGATPVFVDIDPAHYNMDPAAMEAAITPRTRAIIPVHLYGQPAPMDEIMAIAQRHGLFVVEDCAQAHGSTYKGKPVGTWGDLGTFSFYPGKNLGAYGDAGAVITNNEEMAHMVNRYHDHGRTEKYIHDYIGVNSRLDTIQAAILRIKLARLAEWTEARRQVAAKYDEAFRSSEAVQTPQQIEGGKHVYHLYVIQTAERDRLQDHLKAKGVATGIHYPVPLHVQPAYAHLGYKKGQFPVAEALADRILSLPIYAELTGEQSDYIISAVGDFE
jgi:dTDP-4-amino-4,6-dideoxygalactose transaminase